MGNCFRNNALNDPYEDSRIIENIRIDKIEDQYDIHITFSSGQVAIVDLSSYGLFVLWNTVISNNLVQFEPSIEKYIIDELGDINKDGIKNHANNGIFYIKNRQICLVNLWTQTVVGLYSAFGYVHDGPSRKIIRLANNDSFKKFTILNPIIQNNDLFALETEVFKNIADIPKYVGKLGEHMETQSCKYDNTDNSVLMSFYLKNIKRIKNDPDDCQICM